MPTERRPWRLPALCCAALLLAAPAAAAAPPAALRHQAVPARPANGANPFRLNIQRSEYVLQGTSGRLAGRAAGQRLLAAKPFSPLIERQARAKGVDPGLVHAVIRAESAYRPDAVSPKGAVGLMQLMPATARRFGVVDREHPESNVSAGTAYLRLLLDRFDSVPLALAAYNAGEGAVMRQATRSRCMPRPGATSRASCVTTAMRRSPRLRSRLSMAPGCDWPTTISRPIA